MHHVKGIHHDGERGGDVLHGVCDVCCPTNSEGSKLIGA